MPTKPTDPLACLSDDDSLESYWAVLGRERPIQAEAARGRPKRGHAWLRGVEAVLRWCENRRPQGGSPAPRALLASGVSSLSFALGGDATAIEGRSYREVMEAATFESGESLFVAADVNWDTDDARLLGKELRVVQTGEPVAIGTPVIILQRAGRRRLVAGGCVGRVSRWGFVPRCCYHLGATSVEKWKHFTWPFRVFVLAR